MCLLCFACNREDSYTTKGNQPQENVGDWEITAEVKTEIMADASITSSARFVSVNTTNGVVTLTGTVSSQDERDRIVNIAKSVTGVVSVNNQMTISNK